MVLENIIREKIIELQEQAEDYIKDLDYVELAEYNLFAVNVLNDIIEQYNNGV